MKIMHLLRSKPDETVRRLIDGLSGDDQNTEALLYEETVDYTSLIEDIFANDRVVCWW